MESYDVSWCLMVSYDVLCCLMVSNVVSWCLSVSVVSWNLPSYADMGLQQESLLANPHLTSASKDTGLKAASVDTGNMMQAWPVWWVNTTYTTVMRRLQNIYTPSKSR